ncbi:MAG: hypothetical protein ACFB0C_19695 [Leptolyngbyaceae cyanobacterium]
MGIKAITVAQLQERLRQVNCPDALILLNDSPLVVVDENIVCLETGQPWDGVDLPEKPWPGVILKSEAAIKQGGEGAVEGVLNGA